MKRRIEIHIDRVVVDETAAGLVGASFGQFEAELRASLAERLAADPPAGFAKSARVLAATVARPGPRGLAEALAGAGSKGQKA